jgi:hypothetical protein
MKKNHRKGRFFTEIKKNLELTDALPAKVVGGLINVYEAPLQTSPGGNAPAVIAVQ